MTVFVLPLRAVAVSCALALGWLICFITVFGLSPEQLKQPLTGWRRWVQREIGPPVAQLVFFACGFLFFRTKGKRASCKEAPILVIAPHSSWTDALLHFVDDVSSPVSRIDNGDIPIIGTLVKFMQPVFVTRSSADSRAETINEIKRRANSNFTDGKASSETKQPSWQQVAIFPEGTTTNRQSLITFKTGAFQPGVPVQPVVVRWPNYFDTVTWAFVGPSFFKLLWLQLCQVNTFLEIQYLPVYVPDETEKTNPSLFARNVRQIMASALNIPITDHTYRDGLEFRSHFLASQKSFGRKLETVAEFNSAIGLTPFVLQDMLGDLVQKKRSSISITRENLVDLLGIESEDLKDTNFRKIFEAFVNSVETPRGQVDLEALVMLNSVWCSQKMRSLEPMKHALHVISETEDPSDGISEQTVSKLLRTLFGSSTNPSTISEIVSSLFKLKTIPFNNFKECLSLEQLDSL